MTENDRCSNGQIYITGTSKQGTLCALSSTHGHIPIPNIAAFWSQVVQYVGDIKGGMKPSMRIIIMGVVDVRPKSFTISLMCSPKDADQDVALLLTVNFQDRSIVRNAKFAGMWGAEEKKIPYFPFTAGDNFKMEILCEHQQMKVLLDGQQLFDFTHRIQQLRTVTALKVTGDIKLTKVV